jgi:predicted nucleic acid-binding protein
MSADRALADTNVLVYALFPTAPQHADSRMITFDASGRAFLL